MRLGDWGRGQREEQVTWIGGVDINLDGRAPGGAVDDRATPALGRPAVCPEGEAGAGPEELPGVQMQDVVEAVGAGVRALVALDLLRGDGA